MVQLCWQKRNYFICTMTNAAGICRVKRSMGCRETLFLIKGSKRSGPRWEKSEVNFAALFMVKDETKPWMGVSGDSLNNSHTVACSFLTSGLVAEPNRPVIEVDSTDSMTAKLN